MSFGSIESDISESSCFGNARQIVVPGIENLSPKQQRAKIQELREHYYPELRKGPDPQHLHEQLERLARGDANGSATLLAIPSAAASSATSSAASTAASTAASDPEEEEEFYRAEDRRVRQLLEQDNCPPSCPKCLEFPYLLAERGCIPEDDRDGFAYFLPEGTKNGSYFVHCGILDGQCQDWALFRFWEEQGTVLQENHYIEHIKYMEKRIERLRNGRIPKKTQLEDLRSYQAYHIHLLRRNEESLGHLEKENNSELNAGNRGILRVKMNDINAEIAWKKTLLRWIGKKVQSLAAAAAAAAAAAEAEAEAKAHALHHPAAKVRNTRVSNSRGQFVGKRKRGPDSDDGGDPGNEDVALERDRRKKKRMQQHPATDVVLPAQRVTRSQGAKPTQFYELDDQSQCRQQEIRPIQTTTPGRGEDGVIEKQQQRQHQRRKRRQGQQRRQQRQRQRQARPKR